jgi:leucyl/phenylalanyl-tRNA--protein transferase
LHRQGYIQSIEVWDQDKLIGGIFGVTIEKLFFGEYLVGNSEAIKSLALSSLIKRLGEKGYKLMDMQKDTVFFQGIPYEELARLNYVTICKENATAISK